ncbi:MAG: hypothetical protein KAU31_01000 [Spirochaetaceae bacterium]|nr:hypothetical protein [Spirochaetaceae bacterium]
MTHQDRDRLAFSIVLALVIHAVVIVMLTLIDWEIREYPQMGPVFVELLDYQSTPPVIEPVPEPVEEIPPEPVTDAEPEEQEPAEAPAPQPEPVAPAVQEAERPAVPAQAMASDAPPRDAPPGSHPMDDPFMQDDSAAAAREEARPAYADPFSSPEETPSGELPAWVAEGGTIQPLTSLAVGDQERLAEKEDTLEGFAELMELITQSLVSPQATVDRSQPVTEVGEESSEVSLPGDSSLDWVGGGSRGAVGELALPEIGSADLGGLVPARVVYIIVFDVYSAGRVVPGSLILRQNSGYTAADQKVRRAVSSWRFEPAPGSQPVIAICTLILERDNLR